MENKDLIPINNGLPALVKKTDLQLGLMKKILEQAKLPAVANNANFTAWLNPDCALDMIFVEGGTFMMGGDGTFDGKPIHSVTLSSFHIGKYPITQKQWIAIMGNNSSEFQGDENCPVECVSWNNAQDFIKKLNQKFPPFDEKQKYRLLTEAEWEFAARGGNKSQGYRYAGSDNLDEIAWYDDNSNRKTHPVGLKKANELGIFDMSGNVWEWCNDWDDYDYYKNSNSNNPIGPTSGDFRVLRGGSWYSGATNCRVANRCGDDPSNRNDGGGFRVCLGY